MPLVTVNPVTHTVVIMAYLAARDFYFQQAALNVVGGRRSWSFLGEERGELVGGGIY